MPIILVTNDDGYRSEGVTALADAMRSLGDVTIVAPVEEASAIGHALTLKRPLRLDRISEGVFSVDGTPTDCVNVAITQVLKRLPDMVVSGINKGWNLGDDVTYSGTVAGAMEGALLGVRSIAVSLRQTRGEYRLPVRGTRGRHACGGALQAHTAAPDVSQRERSEGRAQGHAGDRARQAESRYIRGRTARPERPPVLLD